jgi:hypothetical protein
MSCGWFEATRFFYAPLTQNGAKNGAKKERPPCWSAEFLAGGRSSVVQLQ